VTVVASVQYRAHVETAEDAFYKLTNPREQIKAYVFDGKEVSGVKGSVMVYGVSCIVVIVLVICLGSGSVSCWN